MESQPSSIGRFEGDIKEVEGGIQVNGQTIKIFKEKDASQIKWGAAGSEYIADCTGAYLSKEKAQAHIAGGAKKVIMSAPPKDDTPIYVFGVNHQKYTPD
jgi:glyceraldehyde 3-phosphate dehydrogenase